VADAPLAHSRRLLGKKILEEKTQNPIKEPAHV
jgi:hypothetical protein